MTLTPAPVPPPTHREVKAARVVSFRPSKDLDKALRAYCRAYGVRLSEGLEHLVKFGLGLVKPNEKA